MTAQSKLSNILLAATLGVSSAAYATNGGIEAEANAGAKANAYTPKNTTATETNNTSTCCNTVNIASSQPGAKVLYESTPIYKKGFFTDTFYSSSVYEIEESEYIPALPQIEKPELKDAPATNSTEVVYKGASIIGFTRNINTYLENTFCNGNMIYVRCDSNRTKVATRPVTADPAP